MAGKQRKKIKSVPKSKVRKVSRAKGEEYVREDGVKVPVRHFVNIDCKCTNKCVLKVSSDRREKLYHHFRNLGESKAQKLFLYTMMQFNDPKQRRPRNFEDSKARKMTIKYYLRSFDQNDNFNEKVCAQFFADTFCQNIRTIQRWASIRDPANFNHKLAGSNPSNKIDTGDVMNFLNNFKYYESHYTREKNANKKYLPPNYTIARLYKDYLAHCNSRNVDPSVSLKKFYDIVQFNTNISIHVPIQDSCPVCDKLQVAIDHEKNKNKRRRLMKEKNDHLTDVEIARKMLNDEKLAANDERMVITMDLQKALPLPILTSGPAYYKRNFNLYNFGIHTYPNHKDDHMYLWNESEAGRGAVEISTALINFFRSNANNAKHIVTFSDRCSGQNRNIKLILALMRFLSDPTHDIQIIDLKYLVSGHSRLPNDTDFGLIERKLKQYSNVYSPKQYYDIIEKSRAKPFIIHELQHEDFESTDQLYNAITNREKTIDGLNVNWMNMSWIRLERKKPFQMQFKYKFNEKQFKVVNFEKRGNKLKSLFEVITKKQYERERGISEIKKKDLIELLKFIPPEYHDFYKSLKVFIPNVAPKKVKK